MSHEELDIEFLEELLDGDKEFAEELFGTYAESALASLNEAQGLLEAGDAVNSFRPFHTLKGASASVGLTAVQELARQFEIEAKAGHLKECLQDMDTLRAAVNQANSRLKDYLERC